MGALGSNRGTVHDVRIAPENGVIGKQESTHSLGMQVHDFASKVERWNGTRAPPMEVREYGIMSKEERAILIMPTHRA